MKVNNPISRVMSALNPLKITVWENPVFDWQLRLLRWPSVSNAINRRWIVAEKLNAIKGYTSLYGFLVPIVFAVIGGVVITAAPIIYYGLPLVVFAAAGFSLLSNIYYSITAINTILPQMTAHQWEPLRLTMLGEEEILLANYAIVQIRAWRTALLDVAIRLALCLSPVIGTIFLLIGYRGSIDMGTYVLLILFAVIASVGIVLEPIWRMKTVTLIGMTVAAWANSYGVALLVTFGAVMALLTLQIALIAGLLIFIGQASSHLYNGYSGYDYGPTVLFSFSSVGLIIVSVYFFFKAVQYSVFAILKGIAFRG